MKQKKSFFSTLVVSLLFCILWSSCLKNESYSNDSQLLTFSIKTDTIHNFVIDESSKTVTNETDQLPYGTNTTALSATFTASIGAIVFAKDSLSIDSPLFSVQTPYVSKNNFSDSVVYRVISQSQSTFSDYNVQVYVSNVNPNEIILNQKNSQINLGPIEIQKIVWFNDKMWYFSSDAQGQNGLIANSIDGSTWNTVASTLPTQSSFGLTSYGDSICVFDDIFVYKTVDGMSWTSTPIAGGVASPYVFNDADNNQLVTAGSHSGSSIVNYSNDGILWNSVSENLVQISNAGNCYHDGKLYIIGGDDGSGNNLTVFADEASGKWNSISTSFPSIVDPIVFSYSHRLWVVGGLVNNQTTNDVIYSYDGGLTWRVDTLNEFKLPEGYNRAGAQAQVDSNGNLWIIGGYSMFNGGKIYYSDVLVGKMNKVVN